MAVPLPQVHTCLSRSVLEQALAGDSVAAEWTAFVGRLDRSNVTKPPNKGLRLPRLKPGKDQVLNKKRASLHAGMVEVLRVGSPCHCRRITRLTHPMRLHLTIWLHAKRTSKPRRAKASSMPLC